MRYENIEIRMETKNSAFDEEPASEIARVLRALADDIANGWDMHGRGVYDSIGSRIGDVRVSGAVAEPEWVCPSEPRHPRDTFVGCGKTFRDEPDGEGWVDCPHCGLAFDTRGMTRFRASSGGFSEIGVTSYREPPDDAAVDAFAAVMKAKLAEGRERGRSGWDNPHMCSKEELAAMLLDHVRKGDPVDVANFCMMLHARGDDGQLAMAACWPI